MAAIKIRGVHKRIFIRFSYEGKRYEEKTNFYCTSKRPDTCTRCLGHVSAKAFISKLETAIITKTFVYNDFFPIRDNNVASEQETNGKVKDNQSINHNIGMSGPEGLPSSSINAKESTNTVFGEYAVSWFKLQELSYSTKRAYKSVLNTWILPKFGNYVINQISPMMVQQFMSDMKVSGKSPKHIKNTVGVLSAIMTSAMYESLIDKNPVSFVKKPKIKSKQVDALNLQEIQTVLDYLKNNNEPWALFFAVGGYMGMRTGEIMGIQWGDINFDNHTVKIQRTITNGMVKDSTKTAEYRIIEIPPILDSYFENHKKYTYNRHLWIFESSPGHPVKDYRIISNIWRVALKECNIRYRTPYQLRHSFACNAREEGFTDSWIQHMLGHATLDMLMRIYGNRKFVATNTRQGFV